MSSTEPQPAESKPERRRFQYTLGTLMAIVTAFAIVCSYIKITGSGGLVELGSSIAAFIGVWFLALLLALLLYLPCRVTLWLVNRSRKFRTADRRSPAENSLPPPRPSPPAGSTSGPRVE